jgi:hypothetical protein
MQRSLPPFSSRQPGSGDSKTYDMALQLQVGDHVLVNCWWNTTDFLPGMQLPHVAAVVSLNPDESASAELATTSDGHDSQAGSTKQAGKSESESGNDSIQHDRKEVAPCDVHRVKLLYFHRPHQTFHPGHKRFYTKEVLKGRHTAVVAPSNILRRCCILNIRDFFKLQPDDIPENDVFVCQASYITESKSVSSNLTFQSTPRVHLSPLTRERNFVLAHCDNRPIVSPLDIADINFAVSFGCVEPKQQAEQDSKDETAASAGKQTHDAYCQASLVPIVFISDADIAHHVLDLTLSSRQSQGDLLSTPRRSIQLNALARDLTSRKRQPS